MRSEAVVEAIRLVADAEIMPRFQALADHEIIVLGGLAEISEKGLTVLADTATSLQDLDRDVFANQIVQMEEGLKEEEGDALDRAIERLDHFKVIQQYIVSTAMH